MKIKKMKILLLFISNYFLLSNFNSFSQIFEDTSNNKLEFINTKTLPIKIRDNDTTIFYKANLPYSGIDSIYLDDAPTLDVTNTFLFVITYKDGYKVKVETFYPNGVKAVEINFNKGLLNGDWLSWYDNGKKQSISTYYKGNQIGATISLYESGSIHACMFSPYEDGKGIVFEWYEDGKASSMFLPISGGKEHASEIIKYHRNGSIKEKMISNNGKHLWEAYYENGQKLFEAYIVDAPWAPVGRWVWWYENGKKKEERFYKDGETQAEGNYRIGTWSWWDENGNLIKQEKYKDNKLVETKEFLPKAEKKSGE